MKTNSRNTRFAHAVIAAAGLVLAGLAGAGCNSSAPTSPGDDPQAAAPVLPTPDRLKFDFGFFDSRGKADAATQQNFFNAQIRVAVINVVAAFVVTPPVTAFSLALHTIEPSRRSYVWSTRVDGDGCRSACAEGARHQVDWESGVTALDVVPLSTTSSGLRTTRDDGESGEWSSTNSRRPAARSRRIDWKGRDGSSDVHGPRGASAAPRTSERARAAIVFVDASEHLEWYIRWNAMDATGSLRVPDYNDGQEAFWDDRQRDIVCPPAA